MIRRALLLAAAPLLVGAGCFNPDLSSEIGCNDGQCPGDLECVDGLCVADGDGREDASQRPQTDAAPPHDAHTSPDAAVYAPDGAYYTSDANPRITCDPITHESCGDAKSRCAFIVTTQLEPYNGFFGCVPSDGDARLGEPCDYVMPTGDNYYDDCVSGLLCGSDNICQRVCSRLDDDDACEDSSAYCKQPEHLPEVYPYGLCEDPFALENMSRLPE